MTGRTLMAGKMSSHSSDIDIANFTFQAVNQITVLMITKYYDIVVSVVMICYTSPILDNLQQYWQEFSLLNNTFGFCFWLMNFCHNWHVN